LHTIDNSANNLMDLAGLGGLSTGESSRKSRREILLHRLKRTTRSQWLTERRGPKRPAKSATQEHN